MGMLSGKTALITGTNRGIGKELVKAFAHEGAQVIAHSRKFDAEQNKFLEQLSSISEYSIQPVHFDLSDETQINNGLKQVFLQSENIDILVNNAGVAFGASFHMTSISKLKEVFDINFFAQIQIMQLVSRKMLKQGFGSIINMASVGGIEANPGYLAYGSSKAALIWATRCLAQEIGNKNIRVNAIAPGLIDTQMGHYKDPVEIDKILARTPMGRMGSVSDVASMALYLASDSSSYITGQIFRIDGGRT